MPDPPPPNRHAKGELFFASKKGVTRRGYTPGPIRHRRGIPYVNVSDGFDLVYIPGIATSTPKSTCGLSTDSWAYSRIEASDPIESGVYLLVSRIAPSCSHP